ncbi:VTT domain-containing protein [Streptococcaceae bacterium ESL0687]|nr:VTT domain-containing protein [Streptococcaceae bacterium ESL0687]
MKTVKEIVKIIVKIKKFTRLQKLIITISSISALLLMLLAVKIYLPDLILLFSKGDNQLELSTRLRSHGIVGAIPLAILLATPFVPYSSLLIFTGICYGTFISSIFGIIGVVVRNLFFIYIFDKVNHITPQAESLRIIKYIKASKNPIFELSLAYMMPFIPKVALNYALSLIKLPFKQVMLIVLLGSAPKAIFLAFNGQELLQGNFRILIIISLILIIILVLLYIFKYRKLMSAGKNKN